MFAYVMVLSECILPTCVAPEYLELKRCDIYQYAAMLQEIKDREQGCLSKLKSYKVIPKGQGREEIVKLEAKQKAGESCFKEVARGSELPHEDRTLIFLSRSKQQFPITAACTRGVLGVFL